MWHREETPKQAIKRRIRALEIHIKDTEARYAELENRFNVLAESVNGTEREPEE